MVKCNKDQVERLKKALKRETDPVVLTLRGWGERGQEDHGCKDDVP